MTAPSQSTAPTDVAWLCERAALADDVRPLITDAEDGGAVVQALAAGQRTADAIRVVAAALPPREGVWWAWVSARHAAQHAAPGGTPAGVASALAAVERWVGSPDDESRRAAWTAGQRVGLDTPVGCATAAAFFAAGSTTPPDVAPAPVPPGLCSTLVATAVTMSAAADAPRFEALLGAYLAQGVEVVKQLGGWNRAVGLAREHFDAQNQRQLRAATSASPSPSNPHAAH